MACLESRPVEDAWRHALPLTNTDTALCDMAAAIESIERSTAGMDCADFREVPTTIAALECQLHAIGEAAVLLGSRAESRAALDRHGETFAAWELATKEARVELVVCRLENHPDRFTAVENRRAPRIGYTHGFASYPAAPLVRDIGRL